LKDLVALKKKELAGDKSAAGEIDKLLSPADQGENLLITFFDESKKGKLVTAVALANKDLKTNYRDDLMPDVAMVSRPSAPALTQASASDYDNRFVPWCSAETKTCYVSAHMPYTETDDELKVRCKDIRGIALSLKSKGFTTTNIAGDFNTDASRIAKHCQNILPIKGMMVELHTSKGEKGNSCGSNDGHMSEKNIDIMIKYSAFTPRAPKARQPAAGKAAKMPIKSTAPSAAKMPTKPMEKEPSATPMPSQPSAPGIPAPPPPPPAKKAP
jgi:hypothetical protein